MSVTGKAGFDGVPLNVVWDENFKQNKDYRSRYKISLKMDAAAAKKLGVDYAMLKAPYFEGTADIDAVATVAHNDDLTIDLKAALGRSAMNYSFLGFVKHYGAPADLTARLVLKKGKLTAIPNFKLHKSGFDIAGKINFDRQGNLRAVDIENIKGPKTRASAKIEMPASKKALSKLIFRATVMTCQSSLTAAKKKLQAATMTIPGGKIRPTLTLILPLTACGPTRTYL